MHCAVPWTQNLFNGGFCYETIGTSSKPQHLLPNPAGQGTFGTKHRFLPASRAYHRPGGRIRMRQVCYLPFSYGFDSTSRPGRPQKLHCVFRSGCNPLYFQAVAVVPWQSCLHDFSGRFLGTESHHAHWPPNCRRAAQPCRLPPYSGAAAPGGVPDVAAGGHSGCRKLHETVSPPAFRRYAAAGHDCSRRHYKTAAADCGRTHHRTGCYHSGADSGSVSSAATADSHGHSAGNP